MTDMSYINLSKHAITRIKQQYHASTSETAWSKHTLARVFFWLVLYNTDLNHEIDF